MRRGCEFEERALRYLESLGYRILARNYRCREGEIDIIAQEDDDLVFVEVKGGGKEDHVYPAERFDQRKLSRIIACAYRFMEERNLDTTFRIDLIVVVGDRFDHFKNVGFD